MNRFDTHSRTNELFWIIPQIELLIFSAKKLKSSSLIIYAALESRNMLEKIEFDYLVMSTKGSKHENFLEEIRGKTGIHKMNKEFKALKFRYQTFSSAATKVLFKNLGFKPFNYKKSEDLSSKLSQYVHTYSRTNEEMNFEGQFVQDGIQVILDTLSFIETETVTITNGSMLYGFFDFKTLSQPVQNEFERWLRDVEDKEEVIYQRLKKINDEENGGIQTSVDFDSPN